MLIREKLGNLATMSDEGRVIDRLPLEWFECSKRILHKQTGSGRQVVLKFLSEAPNLQQDDVLHADDSCLVVVEVLPCEAIVLRPQTMYEMAYACYEIGNKHLPLFFENDSLLIPYDEPIFRLLRASGFGPETQSRKLLNQFKTTVSPHTHAGGTKASLFAKLIKLTTSPTDE